MRGTKFGQNFFDSTRGQVLGLLRRGIGTVEELSAQLDITDNAVRAHLTTLERDGLVERVGTQPGLRRPHFNYVLTYDAEQLFPKAYSTLFNQLLTTLKLRFGQEEFDTILSEVARSLAAGNTAQKNETVESRTKRAVGTFESMGGAPALSSEGGNVLIYCVTSCPFDASVSQHPEVCALAEAFLSEVTGLEVKERCNKGDRPKCSFELVQNESKSKV
ncbi:MAG: helix-turn-helix domain-containing protein [Chloracidobacterium sp.]|nr:helix-turn-helix domain-containing protein [Chloracidobacterium sp.]